MAAVAVVQHHTVRGAKVATALVPVVVAGKGGTGITARPPVDLVVAVPGEV